MSDVVMRKPPSPDTTLRPAPDEPRPEASALPFLAPPRRPDEIGRLGPYRILRVLGQGAMGLVLQGDDESLGRAVALKVMRPELASRPDARDRFLREARAIAALQHDCIVSIYHVGDDEGVLYIVMPLLKGMTLDEYLRKGRPLTLGQIVRIGRDVARGLQAAHDRGLIHRDVKPANLWLDGSVGGRIKILDFGLSRPAKSDVQLTRSDVVVGSPAYMAPEQVSGRPEARSDVYSLGAVLYKLLSGRLPFVQGDPLALLAALATEEPPHLATLAPQVPAALADLVMQMLSKKPEGRPASAAAVAELLRAAGRGEGGPADVSLIVPAEASLVPLPPEPSAVATQRVRGKQRKAEPAAPVAPSRPAAVEKTEESPAEPIRFPEPPRRRPRKKPPTLSPVSLGVLALGVGLFLIAVALIVVRFTPPRAVAEREKEPPREEPKARADSVTLFDGKSLDAWRPLGKGPNPAASWVVREGVLSFQGTKGMLRTNQTFGDFELEMEWRLSRGGKGGVVLRHVMDKPPMKNEDGVEVRLIDDPSYPNLPGTECCGAIWGRLTPLDRKAYLGADRWNRLSARCRGGAVAVTLNGSLVIDTDKQGALAGLPAQGFITLHGTDSGAEYRAIRVREMR